MSATAFGKTTPLDKADDSTSQAIELVDVTLRFGETVALQNITLKIAAGERLCVLGANGSGKSTLASVISGLLAPDSGSVYICGHKVRSDHDGTDFAAYAAARRSVGLVFQNPDDQLVTTVVEDDVAFGPENLAVPPNEIGRRVSRELARVGMSSFAHADPTRLSGGQKQRVTIAGALAMEPSVLVLDEPGALLDVRGRRGIMRVMNELHAAGTTIVHITHFMDEALDASRVVVLDHGRIILDGTPEAVFSHGDVLAGLGLSLPFVAQLSLRLQDAGIAVPFTCDDDELAHALAASSYPRKETTLRQKESSMKGAAIRRQSDSAHSAVTGREVDLSQVSYSYDDARGQGRRALSEVTFSVAPAKHVALVGHTGSGKSSLLRLLAALAIPDSGQIRIGDISTSTRRGRRRLLGRVGFVMQHPERQLFAETVASDVAFGPHNLGYSDELLAERVAHALSLVGLSDRHDASPFELSGGQQRLCAIAGVIAMQPQVIVFDEPTAGLDPQGSERVRDIIARIHAAGTTIIEVTHSMDAAAQADQVVILNEGTVLDAGTPTDIFTPENAALLRAHGLGLPSALEFALKLNALGFTDLGEPLTIEELVCALVHSAGCRGDA